VVHVTVITLQQIIISAYFLIIKSENLHKKASEVVN